jgi:hypothetical protein
VRFDGVPIQLMFRPLPRVSYCVSCVARRLAEALHDLEDLGSPPQLADTTVPDAVAVTPADRLHPGVARYFREAGIGRPQRQPDRPKSVTACRQLASA